MSDINILEEKHSEILAEMSAVLKRHGVEGKLTRFMIGDPSDKRDQKIEEMLQSMTVDDTGDVGPLYCFICCDAVMCRLCCIA